MRGNDAVRARGAELVEIDPHRRRDQPSSVSRDILVEQAHAIAGRALVVGRLGLVRPGHAGDVEVRPGDAVVDDSAGGTGRR